MSCSFAVADAIHRLRAHIGHIERLHQILPAAAEAEDHVTFEIDAILAEVVDGHLVRLWADTSNFAVLVEHILRLGLQLGCSRCRPSSRRPSFRCLCRCGGNRSCRFESRRLHRSLFRSCPTRIRPACCESWRRRRPFFSGPHPDCRSRRALPAAAERMPNSMQAGAKVKDEARDVSFRILSNFDFGESSLHPTSLSLGQNFVALNLAFAVGNRLVTHNRNRARNRLDDAQQLIAHRTVIARRNRRWPRPGRRDGPPHRPSRPHQSDADCGRWVCR